MNKTLTLILATSLCLLAACSKKAETPAPAAAPAPAPAAAPAPPALPYQQLSPELVAHLVRPHSPVLGPAKAPVTIVEFLDPACEACRAFAPVVKQIMFLYPNEVRVVMRFAAFHPGSDDAIRLLEAARKQGKFESMLTALFDGQDTWASHHSPNIEAAWQIARAQGLDMARARRDAASSAASELLKQETADIVALQVSRTPTFFVNGKLLVDFGPEQLMALVTAELALVTAVQPN